MKRLAMLMFLLISVCTNVFAENVETKTITIENGREEIYDKEFLNCDTMEYLVLPESVKVIGEDAFKNCVYLKKAVLSDNITEIKNGAFALDTNLRFINMPKSLISIKDSAFADCFMLENVKFPENLREIRKAAFSRCRKITQVVLPDGITVISADAFFENVSLKVLCLPSELKTINRQAFALCKRLKELFIPDKTERIEEYAFSECESLQKVYIPQSVNYIDKTAFKFAEPTIYGYVGSYAEQYAQEQGFEFVAVTESMYEQERDKLSAEIEIAENTETSNVITVGYNENEIVVESDGEKVIFTDAKPFIDENDRTQIPVRAVAEMLGFDVDYEDGTVTLQNGERKITLCIGKEDIVVDFGYGVECSFMDTTARIVNDRTYVPIRYIGEMLGYAVEWK